MQYNNTVKIIMTSERLLNNFKILNNDYMKIYSNGLMIKNTIL